MAARLRPWRDAVLASRAPWGGWQWTARSVGLGRTRARAQGAWPEPEGTSTWPNGWRDGIGAPP